MLCYVMLLICSIHICQYDWRCSEKTFSRQLKGVVIINIVSLCAFEPRHDNVCLRDFRSTRSDMNRAVVPKIASGLKYRMGCKIFYRENKGVDHDQLR